MKKLPETLETRQIKLEKHKTIKPAVCNDDGILVHRHAHILNFIGQGTRKPNVARLNDPTSKQIAMCNHEFRVFQNSTKRCMMCMRNTRQIYRDQVNEF